MGRTFADLYVDVRADDWMEQVSRRLDQDGLVTFDGVESRAELVEMASRLGVIFPHRDAASDGVTSVASTGDRDGQLGYVGLTSSELILHTDSSSARVPPTLIMLYCHRQAHDGGESVFTDAKELYRILSEREPQALEQLSVNGSALFGGGKDLHRGAIFTRLDDGRVAMRFRYDGLGFFAAPVVPAVQKFVQLANWLKFSFKLEQGQGYLVHNAHWLHGRTSFEGPREMWRILITTRDQTEPWGRVYAGFQPLAPSLQPV